MSVFDIIPKPAAAVKPRSTAKKTSKKTKKESKK